jgi:Zn-dependent protease with chaperone function
VNITASILLSLGILSFAGLLLYFLIKFIFVKDKIDRSHMVEISRNDEQALFKLIEEVVEEVGTKFPKRIYLSHEVNAGVFYDSTFWSMFIPTEKNLHIGLGLMNATTETEFRGIMAHEFGHFSQKSMRIGSFVHQVNKIIYNQLYDNPEYQKTLDVFKSIHPIVHISVNLQVKTINVLRKLLSKLYDIVNINYMALSREMEFHADEVSAHVVGKEAVKSSLLRINLVDHGFSSAVSVYNDNLNGMYYSKNIFKEHKYILGYLSEVNNLTVKNDLPVVTEFDYNRYDKSKLNVKNQWESHPSIDNRIEAIEALQIEKEISGKSSAMLLLRDAERTQEKLTQLFFELSENEDRRLPLTLENFQKEYDSAFKRVNFPRAYKGYYDNRNPEIIDLNSIKTDAYNMSFDDVFSDENIDRVYQSICLKNDISYLQQIASKEYEVKSFDYDGIKYQAKEAQGLIERLEIESKELENAIVEHDKIIYSYFYKQAEKVGKGNELKQAYLHFFKQDKQFDIDAEFHKSLVDAIEFTSEETPFAQIAKLFKEFESTEMEFKKRIDEMCNYKPLKDDLSPEIRESFNQYKSKNWIYFEDNQYINENLEMLYAAMNNYNYLLSRRYFIDKNIFLEYQLSVL